jgi:hypothetical protein
MNDANPSQSQSQSFDGGGLERGTLDRQLIDRSMASSKFQLAMTGRGLISLQQHHPECLSYLVMYTKVFARMKPSDKQYIVEELMQVPHESKEGSGESGSGEKSSSSSSSSSLSPSPSPSLFRPLPKLQVMVRTPYMYIYICVCTALISCAYTNSSFVIYILSYTI